MIHELARLKPGTTNVESAREAQSPEPKAQSLEQAKLAEFAREFEAMLLAQLLNQMRQSMFGGDEDKGFGSETETMFDTINGELARQLARMGGVGLAEALIACASGASSASGASIAPEAPVSPEAPEALVSPEAPEFRVSSAFGWRRDPFTDRPRFHAGVDFAAAYGTAVPAPAGGRVIFAGEQGGYGLTVVVDHGRGLQTRYAHLSASDVRPGDVVAAGQEVGRIGQSGRATGPHLHFEVIQNGERVNPELLAAAHRLPSASLKMARTAADSLSGGDPSVSVLRGADHED